MVKEGELGGRKRKKKYDGEKIAIRGKMGKERE